MVLHDLQAEIIRRLAGASNPAHEVVESLFEDHGHSEKFLSHLLEVLADIHLNDEDARIHFHRILKHRSSLEERLGREVDFRVALLDYFLSCEPRLKAPKIVELSTYQAGLRLATVDELTGLYNRRFLESYLEKELNRARRYAQQFSIIFVDLDNFKRINDTHGHAVGDQVLRCFGRMLMNYLRREDMAGRYGGEEFVIVMPQTSSTGAVTFAERLLVEVRQARCISEETVTFSAGIASYPDHGYGVYELLKNADAALYEAKLGGKNQIKLSAVEKRASRRYEAGVPVECYFDDKLVGTATACDVSLNGISLQSSNLLQPGSSLRLTVHSEPDDIAYEVSTRVVWAQKRDGTYRLGVRWEAADSETVRELVDRFAAR